MAPQLHNTRWTPTERITSTVIAGASHALFPEQPDAVAAAIIGYRCK
jgi:hypothetical protein